MRDYKKMAIELAMAESEAAVNRIIASDDLLSNSDNWAPYNNEEKNWDRVGNQTAGPAAALTEKVVNSIDAVLMRECLKRGIKPESDKAPTSMREAVKTFFGILDGILGNADQVVIKKLADNIQIVVSGDQKTPCYSIIDKGEGQLPERFPHTYVSLSRKNKEGIVFVQGKYNMGGSGVLPFCGNNFYQLIIARRNNDLVNDKKANLWGFTLVRRRAPRAHEALPVVEYFIIGGKEGAIASFYADSLPLLPSDDKNLFSKPFDGGTFIKLYDYKMGAGDRSVDFGLYNALCRTMYMSCLPVALKDSRVEKGHTWQRIFAGADVRLENEEQEYIRDNTKFSFELSLPEIGNIPCVAIPFTRKVNWMGKNSTVYLLNGQVHGYEQQDFLEKANLPWLKKMLLVVVDCTDIDKKISPMIFKPDRERMWDRPEANMLRKELCQALGRHPGLKELNRKIHEERSMSVAKDETDVQEIFSQLAQSDPNMAALFDVGNKLLTLIKSKKGDEVEFKGRKFPTILKPIKDFNKNGGLQMFPCSGRFIKAITDAENEYLMRTRLKGKLVTRQPEGWSVSCTSLNNGIANFKLTVPDSAKAGDSAKIFIGFIDVEKIDPLGFEFNVKIVPVPEKGKPPVFPPDETEEQEKRPRPKLNVQLTRNMPKIIEVWEEDWDKHDMDEKSGFVIMPITGTAAIEIYLNMSNIYLTQYLLKYKRQSETEIIKKQYKIAMALMGCVLWKKVKEKENKDDVIDMASSAISQIILSAVRRLGGLSASEEHDTESEESFG